jgi:hypothetical protein
MDSPDRGAGAGGGAAGAGGEGASPHNTTAQRYAAYRLRAAQGEGARAGLNSWRGLAGDPGE